MAGSIHVALQFRHGDAELGGDVLEVPRDRLGVVRRLRELAELTDVGTVAMVGKDLAGLGGAMDRAHAVLADLGVSTPRLDELCAVARTHGALGAKLTGAGGGGSVIAIAPREREAAILAAWKQHDVTGFVTTIGGGA